MSLVPAKQDVSKSRFALPNDIWAQNLRPPAFAVLAYLQYCHCRKLAGTPTPEELAERTRMSVDMARSSVDSLIRSGFITEALVPVLPGVDGGKFFTIPAEVFLLRLGHGALAVYAYLLFLEDRRTHQCHPSYSTISTAVGLAINTVMKHINKLADRQFITIERTSYIDNRGMKWNSNNLYTILPIQYAAGRFYQRQLEILEQMTERQRVAKRLQEQKAPHDRL